MSRSPKRMGDVPEQALDGATEETPPPRRRKKVPAPTTLEPPEHLVIRMLCEATYVPRFATYPRLSIQFDVAEEADATAFIEAAKALRLERTEASALAEFRELSKQMAALEKRVAKLKDRLPFELTRED